jgi:HPt (histidine-containing phosphotransfer) domain-containing protein
MSMMVIDRDKALERVEGDAELLRELVQLLLEDIPVRLAQIRSGLDTHDAETLRGAAHSLKGAAANLCADGVTEAARRLELAARDQDFGAASHAERILEVEIDSLQRELAALA